MAYDWGKEKRERDAWLASLKEGDEVVITGHRYNGSYLATITRTTATQIITGKPPREREQRWRRGDGRRVGDIYSLRIEKPTQKLRDSIECAELQSWLSRLPRDLSLNVLRVLKTAYDTTQPEKSNEQ